MGRLDGKVAFITGAGRGQGRSHALRLSAEGAEVIVSDICAPVDTVGYEMSSEEDLAETVRLVEANDRRAISGVADVREPEQLDAVLEAGLSELGRVDIIVPNAGIAAHNAHEPDPRKIFEETVAINLFGVRHTVHAVVPTIIEQGEGGSIAMIGSTQGASGAAGSGKGAVDGYGAAKHGTVGLMRSWANWLAPHKIRVNMVMPTGVNTPMIVNPTFGEYIDANPELAAGLTNLMDVEMVEPEDVSAAVAWLVSDEARYVTGVMLPVDAGFLVK
jgi:SDR family mycofactocin-dependent oxidoreductase